MSPRSSATQPSLPQTSTSLKAMSLTATQQSAGESHVLPPPRLFQSDSGEGSRVPAISLPQMRMQPLPPPTSFEHSYYRPRLSTMHPLDFSQQYPTAPLGHILHQPDRSPRFIPLQTTHLKFTAGNTHTRHPGEAAAPHQPIRQAKKIGQRREMRDGDYPHINASSAPMPTRTADYKRPQTSSAPPQRDRRAAEIPPSESNSRAETSRPMQISELISSTNSTEKRLDIAPYLVGDSSAYALSLPETQYVISLRQQPIAARACGFGERDRRVIDPPPILQMTIDTPGATPDEISTQLRYPFSVIHCELWNATTDNEETAMPEVGERRQQRRLMGTLVSSPFVGRDENDKEGCFFCFPDLSCRTSGEYRLRFVLVVLDPTSMKPGDKAPFRATVMSQPFKVYAAKDFPGMKPSTELTKRLKEQGCLISVKKGNEKTSTSHAREESDGEDDGEEESTPSTGKGKGKRTKK